MKSLGSNQIEDSDEDVKAAQGSRSSPGQNPYSDVKNDSVAAQMLQPARNVTSPKAEYESVDVKTILEKSRQLK